MSIDPVLLSRIYGAVDCGNAIRAFHYAVDLFDRRHNRPVWLMPIIADLHIQTTIYFSDGVTQAQRKDIVKSLYESIDSVAKTSFNAAEYKYFMGVLKPLIGRKVLN